MDLLKWLDEQWKTLWWKQPAPEPVKEPEPVVEPLGTGDIVGQITGGYMFWKDGIQRWMFIDQQGNDLTSVPYKDLGSYYDVNGGAPNYLVSEINGIKVWKILVR